MQCCSEGGRRGYKRRNAGQGMQPVEAREEDEPQSDGMKQSASTE